jgi:hypothetical protein
VRDPPPPLRGGGSLVIARSKVTKQSRAVRLHWIASRSLSSGRSLRAGPVGSQRRQAKSFPRHAPRPGFANHQARKKFAALPHRTREAERRKAHQPRPRCTSKRCRPPMPGAAAGVIGARSPSGASPRFLPERANAPTQPRPCFTRSTSNAGVTRAVNRV